MLPWAPCEKYIIQQPTGASNTAATQGVLGESRQVKRGSYVLFIAFGDLEEREREGEGGGRRKRGGGKEGVRDRDEGY